MSNNNRRKVHVCRGSFMDFVNECYKELTEPMENRPGEIQSKSGSDYEEEYGECYIKFSVPVDNLAEVAIPGRAVIVATSDEFFGGAKSRDFQSDVLQDPTWLDLYVVGNAQIKATRDRHHSFLEGVERKGSTQVDGEEVPTYELILGS